MIKKLSIIVALLTVALYPTTHAEYFKNTASQGIYFYAYDTTTNTPVTGDAANITPYISKDGAAEAATNDAAPTEIDATNSPGVYWINLTQAETNCSQFVVTATSTTDNLAISDILY